MLTDWVRIVGKVTLRGGVVTEEVGCQVKSGKDALWVRAGEWSWWGTK